MSSSTKRPSRLAAAAAVAVAALAAATASVAAPRPNTSAFAGLGAWIGLFSTPSFADPTKTVAAAARHGVRTLYIETGNYSRAVDMTNRDALGALVEAAHARGMAVVAWYLPSFADQRRDRRRALAAIRYRSPAGQSFDAFALDLEASVVKDVALRNLRVLRLADMIRAAAGSRYPLGAIVPSPVGMQLHPDFWPGFPWTGLAGRFDVVLPMAYSTYHVHGAAATRAYVVQSVALVRAGVANATVPVHAIGGASAEMTRADATGFAQAVADCAPLGYSLYDLAGAKATAWAALAALPPGAGAGAGG